MARSHSHITGTEQRSPLALGAGGASPVPGTPTRRFATAPPPRGSARLAAAMLASTVGLCAPVVAWAYIVEAGLLPTIATALATVVLSGAVVRIAGARLDPVRDPVYPVLPPEASLALADALADASTAQPARPVCGRADVRRFPRTPRPLSRTRAGAPSIAYRQTARDPRRCARLARDVRCPAGGRRRATRRRSRP